MSRYVCLPSEVQYIHALMGKFGQKKKKKTICGPAVRGRECEKRAGICRKDRKKSGGRGRVTQARIKKDGQIIKKNYTICVFQL